MSSSWFIAPIPAIAEVVFSTLVLYLIIIAFARFSGVRSFAQMSTFDIAVVIALGSIIATTAAAQKPPLIQGLAVIATLYIAQLLLSRLRSRFRPFEVATDNRPILLMGAGGEMKYANMRVARVTVEDIRTHLRAANVLDLAAVQAVVMEGTGRIHVLHGDRPREADVRWLLENVRDYT